MVRGGAWLESNQRIDMHACYDNLWTQTLGQWDLAWSGNGWGGLFGEKGDTYKT